MKILSKTGDTGLATVYIAETQGGEIEFVESLQPPYTIEEKWVNIVSVLYGCPVNCKFCDAGWHYKGKLSMDEIVSQAGFLIESKYPDGKVSSSQYKVQFARMGDPAFNTEVLKAIEELPKRYEMPGYMPSVSTIAPAGCDDFLDRLLELKHDKFSNGRFQMQFSIHSSDDEQRDWLIPVKKWNFKKIADYAERFYKNNDRKIILNFALFNNSIVEPEVLIEYFSPEIFIIKITPMNPTYKAVNNGLFSLLSERNIELPLVNNLKKAGYDVILSIGELEENLIGSNCGQHIQNYLRHGKSLDNSYKYEVVKY